MPGVSLPLAFSPMRTARRFLLPSLILVLAVSAGGRGAATPIVGGISGKVSSSVTSLGLAGTVEILKLTGGSLSASVATVPLDGAGNYSIDLPPGDYTVLSHNTEGYINEFWGNIPCSATCTLFGLPFFTVTTTAVTGVDLVLDPGGRVAGTITDAGTGSPIANVSVQFKKSFLTFSKATTDANGNFLSEGGTDTGNITVAVDNTQGYLNQSRSVAVTNGVTTGGVNFALVVGGQVTGTVRDGNGQPIPNVTVTIASGEFLNNDTVLTDALGHYATNGLAPGTYWANTTNTQGYVDQAYSGVVAQRIRQDRVVV